MSTPEARVEESRRVVQEKEENENAARKEVEKASAEVQTQRELLEVVAKETIEAKLRQREIILTELNRRLAAFEGETAAHQSLIQQLQQRIAFLSSSSQRTSTTVSKAESREMALRDRIAAAKNRIDAAKNALAQ
eukprot:TRINITY_DN17822_c0_g1_i1.p1 TRINITY_DN17822_c0_g1~~TRINITY_DN17822_c0_g1_i1.p1  ORF type:complete len:135 (+),score=22.65 TRINITY_DN17822_c0_g1_i1:62-466(+)